MASRLDRLAADDDGFAVGAEHDAPFGRTVLELDLTNIAPAGPTPVKATECTRPIAPRWPLTGATAGRVMSASYGPIIS